MQRGEHGIVEKRRVRWIDDRRVDVHGLDLERSGQPYHDGTAGGVAIDDGRLHRLGLCLEVGPSFLQPGEQVTQPPDRRRVAFGHVRPPLRREMPP